MDDASFMALALEQARLAAAAGEVPVGAVVVHDGQVIGAGRNGPVGRNDPTAHAEMIALRRAADALGNYRLEGCDLYVTLEPCAMCSGAMLHSRIRRVVFGAPDPKTGAAGSVIDLFSQGRLNHQTSVVGGVSAQACGDLLVDFFRARRQESRMQAAPLREDALRTPLDRFDGLRDYPWMPHYLHDLPALAGLRMHYLDEGSQDAKRTWLCLHGVRSWSYAYRDMIPVFLDAGDRIVAPDMIGFGKSDKPKKESAHLDSWHRQVLLEWVERLGLRNVVLVVEDADRLGRVGLSLASEQSGRFVGVFPIQRAAGGREDAAAWDAPFPDAGHRAGPRAFARSDPEGIPDAAPGGLPSIPLSGAADDQTLAAEAVGYFRA